MIEDSYYLGSGNNHALQYNLSTFTISTHTNDKGTLVSNIPSGYRGESATLTATPSAGYELIRYEVTGSEVTGNTVSIKNSDVIVRAIFDQPTYTLTYATTGPGSLHVSRSTGHSGDTVTLYPVPYQYYTNTGYSVTGGTVSGNTFTFGNSDATVIANFGDKYFTAAGTITLPYGAVNTFTQARSASAIITGITGEMHTGMGKVGKGFTPKGSAHNYSLDVSSYVWADASRANYMVYNIIYDNNGTINQTTARSARSLYNMIEGYTGQGDYLRLEGTIMAGGNVSWVIVGGTALWTATGISP